MAPVPNTPKRIKNRNGWRKISDKHLTTAGQGLIEHACQISGSYLTRTALTLDAEQFWGDKFNEPVGVPGMVLSTQNYDRNGYS